jgi:hypothetical protein
MKPWPRFWHPSCVASQTKEENMTSRAKGAVIAAAVAAMFVAKEAFGQAYRNAEELAAKVHCEGVNQCKGQSACKGAGHECAGKNDCKGKGWIAMSAADCKAKGGKVAD